MKRKDSQEQKISQSRRTVRQSLTINMHNEQKR